MKKLFVFAVTMLTAIVCLAQVKSKDRWSHDTHDLSDRGNIQEYLDYLFTNDAVGFSYLNSTITGLSDIYLKAIDTKSLVINEGAFTITSGGTNVYDFKIDSGTNGGPVINSALIRLKHSIPHPMSGGTNGYTQIQIDHFHLSTLWGPRISFRNSKTQYMDDWEETDSGQHLGRLEAYGCNSSNNPTLSSVIEFIQNGDSTTGAVPGKIDFYIKRVGNGTGYQKMSFAETALTLSNSLVVSENVTVAKTQTNSGAFTITSGGTNVISTDGNVITIGGTIAGATSVDAETYKVGTTNGKTATITLGTNVCSFIGGLLVTSGL